MAVCFHAQRTAVFMPEPPRNRWNVHTAFDADGREEMPQIMVRYAFDSDLCGRMRHAVLTLKHPHDRR